MVLVLGVSLMHSNDEFGLVDGAWHLIGRIWNFCDHYLMKILRYMHDMNVIQELERSQSLQEGGINS